MLKFKSLDLIIQVLCSSVALFLTFEGVTRLRFSLGPAGCRRGSSTGKD